MTLGIDSVNVPIDTALETVSINYLWLLDGEEISSSTEATLTSTQATSSTDLVLEIDVEILPNDGSLGVACTCSQTYNVLDLALAYDHWSCACQPGGAPQASFYVQNDGGCGNQGFSFVNTVTGGQGPTFDWSFGTNYEYGQSLEASPTVEILIDGGGSSNIPVTLTIVDENGCTDSVTETITVLETPNPGNNFSLGNICTGNPSNVQAAVEFTPMPYGNGGIDQIVIDWGTEIETHIPPGTPSFQYLSPLFNDFGYYPITVELTANNGCVETITDSLFIGNNPQIGTANPGNTDGICGPYILSFPVSNFASNDPSTTYEFDFGDGTAPQVFNHPPPTEVVHTYTTSSCESVTPLGSQNAFMFTITASNECGSSNTSVDPIRIHSAPDPSISGEPEVCAGSTYTWHSPHTGTWVDATSTACSNQDGLWRVLDPTTGLAVTSAEANPVYGSAEYFSTTFYEEGEYTIEVIEDHIICDPDTAYFDVCVYPDQLNPVATHSISSGCAPLTIDLSDITPPLICGQIQREWNISGGSYQWNTGGSSSENTTVTLLDAGNYTISLVHEPDINYLGSYNLGNTCSIGVYNINIQVYDTPSFNLDANDNLLCEGGSTVTTVDNFDNGNLGVYDITWYVNGVETNGSNSQISVSPNNTGSTTIEAVASNMCGTFTDSEAINVYEIPDVTVNPVPAQCYGDQVTVVANGASSYIWSTTTDLVGTTINSATYQVTTSQTGYVTGSVFYSNLTCQSTESFSLQVLPLPIVNINGIDEICVGDTIDLLAQVSSGTPEYSYTWSQANLATGEDYNQVATPSLTQLQVTVEDINGCQSEDFYNLTIHDLPFVEAGENIQLCDQPILTTLEGQSPIGGTWSGTGVVNPISGTIDPELLGLGFSSLQYSYTDNNGCTNQDYLTVEVIQPVQADAGMDIAICQADTVISLDAFPTFGGQWNDPSIDSNYDLDLTGLAPGVYSYTYEYGVESCLTSDMMQVQIQERPEISWTYPTQLCINENGVFEIAISGGQGPYLIEWNTPMNSISIDGLTAENSWSTPGTYTVEVFVTDMNGCMSFSSVEVVVNPFPVVFAGNDTTFCHQTIPGVLSGFSPGLLEGGVGQFIGLDAASIGVSSEGTIDPISLGVGVFEVVYEFTSSSTGCTHTDTLQVEVTAPVIADAGLDAVVCNNIPELQLVGYSPQTGVVWSGTNALTNAAVSNSQTGLINPTLLTPGEHSFQIEYGIGTCYSTDYVNVEVSPLPNIVLGTTDVFCSNDEVMPLSSFTPVGGQWEGTGIDNSSVGTFNTGIGAGVYDIIYHYTDTTTQCSDTANHQVIVQEIPSVYAGPDTTFCNQSIPGQIEGFSPGLLEGGFGAFYGLGDAFLAVSITGEVDPVALGVGTFEVVYEFTSAQTGCINSDTLTIQINDPLVVDAGLDSTVCYNAPLVQLEGYFPTAGGLWSGVPNNALIDNQLGVVNPQNLSPGTYTLQLEYGVGTCYSTDFLDLTVDPLPTINLGATDVFCSNEEVVSLTSFTPFGGIWEGTGVVDEDIGTFNTGEGPNNYDLFYWYTDPTTLCSDTLHHLVIVQDIPVVFAGNDTTFCDQPIVGQLEGFSPGLTDGGFGVFYGIGPAMMAISPTGGVDPNLLGVGTFDVVYEFTSAQTGCTNSDTLTIQINEPLVANAGLDTTVCHNAPMLQLEGYSPLTSVVWSGENAEGNNALYQTQTGLINPQLLSPGIHTYQIEYGVGTCYSTDFMEVIVNPLPNISLGADESFCGNLLIEDLNSPFPQGGYWFGDIVSDADLGYINTSFPPATYATYYTYTDQTTLCSDTVSKDVTIHPVPVAQFENDTLGCTNIDLPITQLSSGATQYLWEFGNAESSNAAMPLYTYPGIGEYTITLYASNTFGCTDTTTSEVEITELPQSMFTLSTDNGCAPLEVEVDNVSYAPYSQFEWNSNGIIYSVEDIPTQTYSQGDSILNVELSLTTTNLCGSSVLTDLIDVYPQPQMDLAFFSDTACSPFTAELLNLSVGLPDVTTWDYGNGQNSTGESPINPTYIVDTVAVMFYATVYGENQCGVDSATAPIYIKPNTVTSFFSTNLVTGCPPLNLTVEDLSVATTNVSYDFGDGNYSLNPDASNVYYDEGEFVLTQFVTNGCSYDTSDVTISVHPYPIYTLNTQSQQYCEGETAIFVADPVNPGSVEWDFDDGETSNGLSVSHEFTDAGIYEVEATVQSNLWGCSSTESLTIEVTPTPTIDVQIANAFGCSPLTVEFENFSQNADFWIWDFGDNSPGNSSPEPTHLFSNNTTQQVSYEVQILANTISNCTADTTLTIDVLPEPISNFIIPQELFCGLPNSAYIVNESEYAESYVWMLNGDSVSLDLNPEISFDDYGYQTIQLISTNQYGCESQASEIIEIHELPQPQLQILPQAGCVPHEISISDLSIGSIQSVIHIGNSEWDLYTGPIPNDPISIIYSGNYLVSLTTISAEGCTNNLESPETIWVWPEPTAYFDIVPVVNSEGDLESSHPSNTEFIFDNLSQDYYHSHWDFGNGASSTDDSPIHDFVYVGQYPVTLTVTSEYGCTNSHSEMVVLSSELEIFVPTAFTPTFEGTNSHGINDAFRPVFSDLDLVESYHIQIFNRWGDVVWESSDPEEYWIGETRHSGEYYTPDMIYNWVMKVQSNSWVKNGKELRGFVTIIR